MTSGFNTLKDVLEVIAIPVALALLALAWPPIQSWYRCRRFRLLTARELLEIKPFPEHRTTETRRLGPSTSKDNSCTRRSLARSLTTGISYLASTLISCIRCLSYGRLTVGAMVGNGFGIWSSWLLTVIYGGRRRTFLTYVGSGATS